MRDINSRIQSVKARSGLSTDEVVSRIKNQYDYENLDKTPYTVILNDSDENSLKQKLIKEL